MPDETTQSQDKAEARHMETASNTSPLNTGESMAERIARIKREQAQDESGDTPTSGLIESSNQRTTAGSALRDASDPQRSAATRPETGKSPNSTLSPTTSTRPAPGTADTTHVRSDAAVAAGATTLRGTGPQGQAAEGTDTETAGSRLAAGESARVSDGSKTGERVRATSTSVIPESNDVMLGDQSTRKDGPKDVTNALPTTNVDELKEDGSQSPHDATSDGSRQAMAHQQLKDAVKGEDEDDTPPAFRAEAKARTI